MGVNEIASAIAVHLYKRNWSTLLSHDPDPPVIRRRMSFHDALFDDAAEVEGVHGVYAERSLDIGPLLAAGDCVAVTRLGLLDLIPLGAIHLLIDARRAEIATSQSKRIRRRTALSSLRSRPMRPTASRGCSAEWEGNASSTPKFLDDGTAQWTSEPVCSRTSRSAS